MPDDFRVSERNAERSQALADRFERYVFSYPERGPRAFEEDEGEAERIASEVAEEVPINDVAEDVRSVGRQIGFSYITGLPVPAMNVPEVGDIPVLYPDLLAYEYMAYERRMLGWPRESVVGWIREVQRRISGNIKLVAPGEIGSGFRRGLSLFLGYRFEGFSFWRERSGQENKGFRQPQSSAPVPSGGPPSPGAAAPGGTGFYVELSCVHYHLAAYASPAYALTWRNFGSFTTPAKGVLPPGAWIFGAQGGMFRNITPDLNPVYVPPTFTPSTACF